MINRLLLPIIEAQLFKQKSIVLLGPRQTGKTTLVRELLSRLSQPSIWLNADLPSVREGLTKVGTEQLKQIIGNATLVVIDEAQRIQNIGLTLKIVHDTLPHVQLIATGSSAFDLANEINEPLTGRKWEYWLYPISWQELVDYTTFLGATGQLETRLIYGMYPDVVTNLGNEREILAQLSGSYLYKDLLSFRGIRRPNVLEKLLRALAFQVGSEVSYNELSRLVEIDKATVESYIQLLEQAFVVFRLHPFNRNLRNEINTSRKVYFYDNGIRNALIENYAPLELRNDTGALWENFLVSERMKRNHYKKHYARSYFWRTHAQQEIDYLEESNGQLAAYEFKWNPKAKARFPKTFSEAYPNTQQTVISPQNFTDFLLT
ncbi:ATP-binding protein [Spirosoma sp. SC4-14]|uniref:ATP-binding protein n=1 Tax=Spirosoma sp. SC4-14 TaxID=3128900 RepID=UPI0030CDAF4A